MRYEFVCKAVVSLIPRASVLGLAALLVVGAGAQDKKHITNKPGESAPQQGKVKDNYIIHQSFDLGGHMNFLNGSLPMYDTLVNVHTGPRILNHTLEMHSTDGAKHLLFDTLYSGSTGYGGDPNSFSTLRASKGKAYDLVGSFRRDRQYFDYNLWGNPLVPGGAAAPVSNGYTFGQVMDSPHLFNTVRRNTDLTLTILPVSRISFRAGWNLNEMKGPSFSSIHIGADALLSQNWRNTTSSWIGGVDFKPNQQTTITFEEFLTAYKGDTQYGLTGLNMQLPNGTPTTIGFDIVAKPAATGKGTNCGVAPAVLNSGTNPPTANPCVNDYTAYTRTNPIRTMFPTESFRFQTSAISNVQMTGRVLYSDSTMNMHHYNEYFAGLESRVTTPAPAGAKIWCNTSAGVKVDCHQTALVTGEGRAHRNNSSIDFGMVWKVSESVTVSEQFDINNWRQPATAAFLTTDTYGASAIAPAAVTLTDALEYTSLLSQKTRSNTIVADWEAKPWLQVSAGWRLHYRSLRRRTDEEYSVGITTNSFLADAVVRPTKEWRITGGLEIGSATDAYVQTNARQFERYSLRTTYKPRAWATLSGVFNDTERKNDAELVNYKASNRAIAGTASLAPSETIGVDLNYGYIDAFSRVNDCFIATSQPSGTTPYPVGLACGNGTNTATTTNVWLGNSYYDAPTQYGSVAIVYSPIRAVRAGFGYRINDVQGTTQLLHPLQVPGSLRSRYQTPFANLGYKFSPSWTVNADYNYYGYGEDSPVGPTAPRNFHSNMVTMGMHYQF